MNAIANRVAYEIAKTDDVMTTANVNKLRAAAATFAEATIAELCAIDNIDVAALAQIDVYAIDSAAQILRFAHSAVSLKDLKTNVAEVCETVFRFTANDVELTRDDCAIALDASRKVSADKKHLYKRRADVFASAKRHAQMTISALEALNVVSATSKTTLKVNENSTLAYLLSERLKETLA